MNEIKNEQTEQPKVIYVERKKKPFPWKTIGKYALCCVLSGLCGFGGGLFANYVDRQKTNNDIQYNYSDNNGNDFSMIPGFGDGSSNEEIFNGDRCRNRKRTCGSLRCRGESDRLLSA